MPYHKGWNITKPYWDKLSPTLVEMRTVLRKKGYTVTIDTLPDGTFELNVTPIQKKSKSNSRA